MPPRWSNTFRSHRSLIGVGLLLIGLPHGRGAAQAPQDSTGIEPGVVAGAIVGSAGGMVGGAALARLLSERFGFDQGGEDPGLASTIIGGFAGSMIGAAVGAHIASESQGRSIPFERRLRDTLVGTLLGVGVGVAVSRLYPDEPEPRIIAFSLTQGLYVGLSNGRW